MALFSHTPPIDDARILDAIRAAERRTSGEIRIVLARRKTDDPLAAARHEFEQLGMTQTAARNGVLIHVSLPSHTFAVIGDRGIHEKCGDAFWQAIADAMTPHFQRGDPTTALVTGIERAGAALAEHFPRAPDDRNELPDNIERR